MRIAVGVDIVEVSRVRRLVEDHPEAAVSIFTAHELDYCASKRNRFAHLAARFAAKEAALKALGTGLGPGMAWTDVEVRNDPLGRPRLQLSGQAGHQVRGMDAEAEVSLSHTKAHAVAQVVLLITNPSPAVSP